MNELGHRVQQLHELDFAWAQKKGCGPSIIAGDGRMRVGIILLWCQQMDSHLLVGRSMEREASNNAQCLATAVPPILIPHRKFQTDNVRSRYI